MATETPGTPGTPQPTSSTPAAPKELRLISHSSLFYWWPVWAVGFVLALLTYIQGQGMKVIPLDSKVHENAYVLIPTREVPKDTTWDNVPKDARGNTDDLKARTVITLPTGSTVDDEHKLRTSPSGSLGVIFLAVLMVVIIITNVPLRGMWSVLVMVTAVLLALLFAAMGWWEDIFKAVSLLDIRINMGGYLLIAISLFAAWCITVFLFDQQMYISFEPGQMRVHLEIGEGEKNYDTRGMTMTRERSDWFRHKILGLGSGDLVIRTAGADAHEYRLNNVLFVGHKHRQVEKMMSGAGR